MLKLSQYSRAEEAPVAGSQYIITLSSSSSPVSTFLRKLVEPRFGGPPVVVVGPVTASLLHVGEWNALGPVVDRFPIGPPGAPQPVAQIAEIGRRNFDAKRFQPLGFVGHAGTVGFVISGSPPSQASISWAGRFTL